NPADHQFRLGNGEVAHNCQLGPFTWQCAWCGCWCRPDEGLCRQCKAIRGTFPLPKSLHKVSTPVLKVCSVLLVLKQKGFGLFNKTLKKRFWGGVLSGGYVSSRRTKNPKYQKKKMRL